MKMKIHHNLHKISHNESVSINSTVSLRFVLLLVHNRDLLQGGRGARTWGCALKVKNAWYCTSIPSYIFMKCTRTTLYFTTTVKTNKNTICYSMRYVKCHSCIVFEYIDKIECFFDRCLQIYFSSWGRIQPWSYILREGQQSITTALIIVVVTASLVCSWMQQLTLVSVYSL